MNTEKDMDCREDERLPKGMSVNKQTQSKYQ